jgi:hypothetical protein
MASFVGALFVFGFLFVIYVLPTLHILFSSRSHGGAKFGWILINLVFPILGWGVFLVITQPEKERITQARYADKIRARNRPLFIKNQSPRQQADEIERALSANN